MRTRTALAALCHFAVTATCAQALVADDAGDVCAPAANPCNVTTEIDVIPNSTLDFGTRTVNVTGSGRFDFGSGNGTVLCGKFLTNTSGAAINARGPGPVQGPMESGLVQIEARRGCSLGIRACLQGADCQLGSCSVRRCSEQSTRQCTDNAHCQLGTCIPAGMPNARRCTLGLTTRCTSNADCDLGSCPAQLTCAGQALNPVPCSTDSHCDFGSCSVGEGTIDINSTINGSSSVPAVLLLRAADDLTLRKSVSVNGTTLESDGGEMELETFDGDIQTLGALSLVGGADATGGDLRMRSDGSILVDAGADAAGGDFDGGTVELAAGLDVTVTKSINCNAISGAGFGGEIVVAAERDLIVNAASAGNRTRFSTEGHTDASNFAGDGGTQELRAGRDLRLNRFTRLEGNGSAPDGFGADLFLEASGNFLLSGAIEAKTKGEKGSGGFVEIEVAGNAVVDADGSIDLTGGEGGGGNLDLLAAGAIDYAGTADVAAGGGGSGGNVRLLSDAAATLSGKIVTNGD